MSESNFGKVKVTQKLRVNLQFWTKKCKFADVFYHLTTLNYMMTLKTMLLFGLGGQEILLIALVVLLLFGGAKIPELMKGLGKGVKSFKDGMKEIDEDVKTDEPKKD